LSENICKWNLLTQNAVNSVMAVVAAVVLLLSTRGHGTYTVETVDSVPFSKVGRKSVLFSAPLFMTWCSHNAPNCTDLHLYFQTPPIPQTGEGLSPLPRFLPLRSAHSSTFQSFRGRCYPLIIRHLQAGFLDIGVLLDNVSISNKMLICGKKYCYRLLTDILMWYSFLCF